MSIRVARLKSLVFSVYDGFFYSCMVGFGETYFSAYALFLGANNFQLGVLTCLPPFLAGISQFGTLPLMKQFPSRRRLVCSGVLVQAFSLIPLFLAYKFNVLRIEIYILLVSLYFAAGALVGPVWNSWMGDLVSYPQRGAYFGRRNRVMIVGTFVTMTIAGLMLRHFKDYNLELRGFLSILLLALSSRMTSLYFLSLKLDPKQAATHRGGSKAPALRFFEFMRGLHKRNQGILILYMSSVNFAVFTAAAYFTPWMLRELKFNYSTYTFVLAGIAVTKFMTYSTWGECCDKFGSRKIILISGFLISFSTVPWVFTTKPGYLFLAQCFTGIVWAGYEVSTFAFLLDATEPAERAQVSSYLNILSSIFGLFGGLLGGLIFARHGTQAENRATLADFSLGALIHHPYLLVFALSAVLRLVALGIYGRHLKEVRVVSPVKARDILFKVTGFRTALGMTSRLVILARRRGH